MIVEGKKGDKIEVYFATHVKGGKPIDEAATGAIAAFNEKLNDVRGYKGPKSPPSVSHQQVSDGETSHNQSVYSTSFLFEVGMNIQSLHNVVPKTAIAQGIILSKDPLTKVGGSLIGNGFWEVKFVKEILPNEPLLIGCPVIRKVG